MNPGYLLQPPQAVDKKNFHFKPVFTSQDCILNCAVKPSITLGALQVPSHTPHHFCVEKYAELLNTKPFYKGAVEVTLNILQITLYALTHIFQVLSQIYEIDIY